MSEKDALTKLYNRNYLNQFLDSYQPDKVNNSYMVFFDIDDLKNINDTYGHETGDEILIAVSDIVNKNIRKNDKAIRYGGDEFLIFFPEATFEDAKAIWERINNKIKEHAFNQKGFIVSVSASFSEYTGNFKETFNKIDSYMYEAKNSGKRKTIYDM